MTYMYGFSGEDFLFINIWFILLLSCNLFLWSPFSLSLLFPSLSVLCCLHHIRSLLCSLFSSPTLSHFVFIPFSLPPSQAQSFPLSRNGFKEGMRLEGIDPLHPSMFCILSVAEVSCSRQRAGPAPDQPQPRALPAHWAGHTVIGSVIAVQAPLYWVEEMIALNCH